MNKLIILKGLPASGKTTFAKKWVTQSPKTRIRVNRDDIRRMFGPYWVPSRENLVTRIEEQCIFQAFIHGRDVVLDATNLRNKNWSNVIGAEFELEINDSFLEVPIEECIRRDSLREEKVGEEVITRMYNKYLNNDKI